MSKQTITIVAALGLVLTVISGFVGGTLVGGLGALLQLIAWIWALREAWWTRAFGWLIGIFFTVGFGALAFGIFGPGRLPLKAMDDLRHFKSGVGPQRIGFSRDSAWTPALLKDYLEKKYPGEIEDLTLLQTLKRMHWLV